MYYYIKGKLVNKSDNYIVVDVMGVGYMIFTSLITIESIGSVGNDVTVYTYLNVREDAMELYGFSAEDERAMFLKLISVSGVGPRAGLALLSVATPQRLSTAIITGDEKLLTKANGVGPKAAKRIILELRDKIGDSELGIDPDGVIDSGETVITDNRAEAMSALTVLGYSTQDAKNVLLKLDATISTEELIKQALARLM